MSWSRNLLCAVVLSTPRTHWELHKDTEILQARRLSTKAKIIESQQNKTQANHSGSKHITHIFTQTLTTGPPLRADLAVPPTAQCWRVSRTNWASLHREQWRPEVVLLSRRRGGGGLPVVSPCWSFRERCHTHLLPPRPPPSSHQTSYWVQAPGAWVRKRMALLRQSSWTRCHG